MMNLADPELELIDPTPNIHSMFLVFDKTFFWSRLSSRCVVRWSKRMYSCAGITSYEGRGGLCDIALSEPLLKLRPRKDFIETLLHEMIHAYLFVTNRDQDRDGHGPNFQAHMHRINRAAGLNISIYHDFHDEVKLYQTHWWRCNGKCQTQRPYFGIVRRSSNRPPGPTDRWWSTHKRNCGGTFIKIKEPEKPEKKSKKNITVKPNADITKYINNNRDSNNKNVIHSDTSKKSVLKDSSNILTKPKVVVKSNGNNTIVVTNKNVNVNPQVPKQATVFNGTGLKTGTRVDNGGKHVSTNLSSVLETVRNVWANKQIEKHNNKQFLNDSNTTSNRIKHKAENHIDSPAPKVKKIDDYFKVAATSVLKNVYGQDFHVAQLKNEEKLKAMTKIDNLVDCPVCHSKIDTNEINRHLDECLNKGVIEKFSNENNEINREPKVDSNQSDKRTFKEIVGSKVLKPKLKKEVLQNSNDRGHNHVVNNVNSYRNHTTRNNEIVTNTKSNTNINNRTTSQNEDDLKRVNQVTVSHDNKTINVRKSDSFVVPKSDMILNNCSGNTPQTVSNTTVIKEEPGCSKVESEKMSCLCCGETLNTSVDEHLEECLSFFENNTTIPKEGAASSFSNDIIIIDDDNDDEDDRFDESQTFNATGTKYPCPCCLKMVEEDEMNSHLDQCLR